MMERTRRRQTRPERWTAPPVQLVASEPSGPAVPDALAGPPSLAGHSIQRISVYAPEAPVPEPELAVNGPGDLFEPEDGRAGGQGMSIAHATEIGEAPIRVQRLVGEPSDAPADVQAREAFNAMDINHRLLRAIDQSQIDLSKMKRHVDFGAAVAALSNLTTEEVLAVKNAYAAHEAPRTLEDDLFGNGESGFPSDLTEDQRAQLRALLGGTRAETTAPAAERESAATHAASAQAAELHRLLQGDLEDAEVERVMAILRQDVAANEALIAAYARLGGDLRTDLVRLGPVENLRASMLLAGQAAMAESVKVSSDRARIEAIDAQIMELQEETDDGMAGLVARAKIEKLRKERGQVVGDVEQRAEQARAGARGESGDPAAQARVTAVLGDVEATATTLGGADAAVLKAIAGDDPAARVAAQLRRSAQAGKLSGEQLTAALRGLRAEAEDRAKRSLPKDDPRVEAVTKKLADDYFAKVRTTYDELVATSGGEGKRFDELVADTGDEGDADLNKSLVAGSGQLADVDELVLALQGDRKDTATVERILRNKSAMEIKLLRIAYMGRTGGRSLDYDLFGEAPTEAGEENPEMMGQHLKNQGKASGTNRLNLEDYLQRADAEGGPAEVAYVKARAEREYEYTIENGGATGWLRDKFGNEERSLLDESIAEVRRLYGEYCGLVGWVPAADASGAHLLHPELAHSAQVGPIIQEMRLARATIRGDRAAYEQATAELRAMIQAAASFVIQAALTAVLTPAAAAIFRAGTASVEAVTMTMRIAKWAETISVNTISTIGGNAIAYGSDYSLAQLEADLRGGLGGIIGGEAVGKMLGPVAKGMAERLGPKCSGEILAFAKTVGNMEGGAWAQGMEGDLTLQNVVKTHLMGKGSEFLSGTGSHEVVTYGEHAPTESSVPRSGTAEPTPVPAGEATTSSPADTTPIVAPVDTMTTTTPEPAAIPTSAAPGAAPAPAAPREPARLEQPPSLFGKPAANENAALPLVGPPEPGIAGPAPLHSEQAAPSTRGPAANDNVPSTDTTPTDRTSAVPTSEVPKITEPAQASTAPAGAGKREPGSFRDTRGWSGEPTATPAPGSEHLAVIERGQQLLRTEHPELADFLARVENPLPEPQQRRLAEIPNRIQEIWTENNRLLNMTEQGVLNDPHFGATPEARQAAVERRQQLLEEVNTLEAEAKGLQEQVIAERARLETEGERLMAKLRGKLMREGSPAAKGMAEQVKFDPSAESALKARGRTTEQAQREIGEFYRLTGGRGPDPASTRFEATKARADTEPGRLDIGLGTKKETIFHEMAHHLEFNDPQLAEASRAFVEARASYAAGDRPVEVVPLKELVPGADYRPDEVGMAGDFASAYTGKVYPAGGRGQTEVVTTGLERFTNPRDMLDLFLQDPEHFFYTLGALRK